MLGWKAYLKASAHAASTCPGLGRPGKCFLLVHFNHPSLSFVCFKFQSWLSLSRTFIAISSFTCHFFQVFFFTFAKSFKNLETNFTGFPKLRHISRQRHLVSLPPIKSAFVVHLSGRPFLYCACVFLHACMHTNNSRSTTSLPCHPSFPPPLPLPLLLFSSSTPSSHSSSPLSPIRIPTFHPSIHPGFVFFISDYPSFRAFTQKVRPHHTRLVHQQNRIIINFCFLFAYHTPHTPAALRCLSLSLSSSVFVSIAEFLFTNSVCVVLFCSPDFLSMCRLNSNHLATLGPGFDFSSLSACIQTKSKNSLHLPRSSSSICNPRQIHPKNI